MTTEITTPKNPMDEFQARLKEKLRNDIASMLPDLERVGVDGARDLSRPALSA